MAKVCDGLLSLISKSGPSLVECKPGGPPMLIFSGSAFQKNVATVGAVIIDPEHRRSLVYDGAQITWSACGNQWALNRSFLKQN